MNDLTGRRAFVATSLVTGFALAVTPISADGADSGIPAAHVDMMKAELAAANNPSEIVLYPDTPHGFNADYRPSYRKAAADDAWKRMRDWFAKNGAT